MVVFAASGGDSEILPVTSGSARDPGGAPESPLEQTRAGSRYYVVVLIPESGSRWLAQFPDLPGCRAVGEQIELVIYEAAAAASNVLQGIRERGMEPPAPRSLEEVRADTAWVEKQSIEWSKALISMIAIP